jgi:hypothetical protein
MHVYSRAELECLRCDKHTDQVYHMSPHTRENYEKYGASLIYKNMGGRPVSYVSVGKRPVARGDASIADKLKALPGINEMKIYGMHFGPAQMKEIMEALTDSRVNKLDLFNVSSDPGAVLILFSVLPRTCIERLTLDSDTLRSYDEIEALTKPLPESQLKCLNMTKMRQLSSLRTACALVKALQKSQLKTLEFDYHGFGLERYERSEMGEKMDALCAEIAHSAIETLEIRKNSSGNWAPALSRMLARSCLHTIRLDLANLTADDVKELTDSLPPNRSLTLDVESPMRSIKFARRIADISVQSGGRIEFAHLHVNSQCYFLEDVKDVVETEHLIAFAKLTVKNYKQRSRTLQQRCHIVAMEHNIELSEENGIPTLVADNLEFDRRNLY